MTAIDDLRDAAAFAEWLERDQNEDLCSQLIVENLARNQMILDRLELTQGDIDTALGDLFTQDQAGDQIFSSLEQLTDFYQIEFNTAAIPPEDSGEADVVLPEACTDVPDLTAAEADINQNIDMLNTALAYAQYLSTAELP